MRPYFFKKTAAAEDRRIQRYRSGQREAGPVNEMLPKRCRGAALTILSVLSGLTGGLVGGRELAAWLRADEVGLPRHIVKAARDKAIAAAEAKRERRRARNLRWWANDRTWQV